jgi:prepilin-type N-terminal cleavage/methylation domain-containing protein
MLTNARRARRGFSLIELLIVIAIILIIAAIAAPKLNVARMQAQEMAAVRTLTTIHVGETSYFSQFGKFAESLQQLGPPAGGAEGPAAANLIPGDLATGQKSGYVFTLTATKEGYSISAVPQIFGQTGRRTFYSDQTMTVRENWSAEPATAQSKEIK